jgi:hypothetical protein
MVVSGNVFPSGPWTGFYAYAPADRHRMDLNLTFANEIMSGDGIDDVGWFIVRGQYSEADRECHWTKTYPASHDVYYQGYREGKGIWGRWEIGLLSHGGFHIWPRGSQEGEADSAAKEEAVSPEAVGAETGARIGEFPFQASEVAVVHRPRQVRIGQ